jgi:hypothetical protein
VTHRLLGWTRVGIGLWVLLLIPLTFAAVAIDTKLLSDHAAYGKITNQ